MRGLLIAVASLVVEHSLLACRTSFSISCKVEVLVTIFLVFLHLQCLYVTLISVRHAHWLDSVFLLAF